MLSDEDIERAVESYYLSGRTQADIARTNNCTQQAISLVKLNDQRWKDAKHRLVEDMKDQGLPVAWQCLIVAAKKGSVSAANEILSRIEGATEQTLRIINGSAREKLIGVINSIGERIEAAERAGEPE